MEIIPHALAGSSLEAAPSNEFPAGLLTYALSERTPSHPIWDSGLLLPPTQLQWRGRAGFQPDFPSMALNRAIAENKRRQERCHVA